MSRRYPKRVFPPRIPGALIAMLLAFASTSGAAPGDETPCRDEWADPGYGVAVAEAVSETDASAAIDSAQSDEVASEKPPGLPKMALDDAIHVLSAPIHWSLAQWGLAAASIGTIAALGELGDVHLRYAVRKNQSGVLDDLTKVVEPFGAEYGWAVVGAYGVVGFVFHDPDSKNIAFDAAMSGLLSGAITGGLKQIVGRARPEQDFGAAHVDPFGGDTSFPSGHATIAFAIGSVIAAHSDQAWVKVSAFSIASLVAFARVYHDAHWSSDVAAGALVGTLVGETIVRFNSTLRARGAPFTAYAAPIYGDGRRGSCSSSSSDGRQCCGISRFGRSRSREELRHAPRNAHPRPSFPAARRTGLGLGRNRRARPSRL